MWKKIITTEKKSPPADTKEIQGKTLPLMSPQHHEKEYIKAQEARLVNDVDLMLQALEHEKSPLNRHLLYRDIIAQSFPKRHQDPQMRERFMNAARAHIKEMPEIISELVDRFGSKPYFFTFSYYAIALTECMEFDQAIEICRLALAYEAKDGLGVGFEKRIHLISQRKAYMLARQAA